ncbi:MAG: hypothetical protein LC102_02920 [Ignavibacteriales bacterium]|nr:MAG: hypothetical protein F9K26_06430 [Ignavibacteriaceae bacterium]MBW7873005.1 hypothetical protein [Ignavibacteria bacterium]MCZ2142366.1 hypothetical protein [Ignavibacteriales bacterium]OQY72733.1 MAG: hypothetical protein B6D45_08840 [Ignavibacteriales bacterium UTCHB3]MBZ0196042.1 hypothetical protein [Ignavibacteriaceae bacterium]
MSYHAVVFKSKLPLNLRDELERIFFFNQRQGVHSEKIQEAIDTKGFISIVEKREHLLLQSDKLPLECLFALDADSPDASLLGVICYNLEDKKCKILHIAVDPECAASGEYESELLTFRLVEKVRKLAVDKKMESVELPYSGKILHINRKILDIFE